MKISPFAVNQEADIDVRLERPYGPVDRVNIRRRKAITARSWGT
jgi:hypothetical protein